MNLYDSLWPHGLQHIRLPSVLVFIKIITLMVGWHHQLNGHESEQALRVGDGKEAWPAVVHGVTELDMAERLNWTNYINKNKHANAYIYKNLALKLHFRRQWPKSISTLNAKGLVPEYLTFPLKISSFICSLTEKLLSAYYEPTQTWICAGDKSQWTKHIFKNLLWT